jgi:hypothetical protein
MLDPRPAAPAAAPALPGQPTGTFSNERASFGAVLNDFFGRRPIGEQPIEFPHNTHIGFEISCETCHEGVTTGPVAGLPSVRTCMICHEAIATDRPRIQQITQMRDQGIDLQWSRVYGYVTEAHVKFNHAPHIRRGVQCATCHGDLSQMTVAERVVDQSMGFCVNCHNENQAPVDCMTCHF